MAVRVGVQPLNLHNWITNNDLTDILENAVNDACVGYDPIYEDYVGIYHQIMAIELGYINQ